MLLHQQLTKKPCILKVEDLWPTLINFLKEYSETDLCQVKHVCIFWKDSNKTELLKLEKYLFATETLGLMLHQDVVGLADVLKVDL